MPVPAPVGIGSPPEAGADVTRDDAALAGGCAPKGPAAAVAACCARAAAGSSRSSRGTMSTCSHAELVAAQCVGRKAQQVKTGFQTPGLPKHAVQHAEDGIQHHTRDTHCQAAAHTSSVLWIMARQSRGASAQGDKALRQARYLLGCSAAQPV